MSVFFYNIIKIWLKQPSTSQFHSPHVFVMLIYDMLRYKQDAMKQRGEKKKEESM